MLTPPSSGSCFKCGEHAMRPHGGDFKCRACGAVELSPVRCPACEGIDYPGVAHVRGCVNDPEPSDLWWHRCPARGSRTYYTQNRDECPFCGVTR